LKNIHNVIEPPTKEDYFKELNLFYQEVYEAYLLERKELKNFYEKTFNVYKYKISKKMGYFSILNDVEKILNRIW